MIEIPKPDEKALKKDKYLLFTLLFIFFIGFVLVFTSFIFTNNASFFKKPVNQFDKSQDSYFTLKPKANASIFYKKNKSNFFNVKSFYDEKHPIVEIYIEPEFLQTLNASVTNVKGCKKIRNKKVSVKEIRINSEVIKGKSWLRYPGYCHNHWLGKQKSMKIQLGSYYKGIRTLNLNTLATDTELFDVWSGQLVTSSGGFASRVSIAQLYINGKYDGYRFTIENLDKDLLRNLDGPKGEIYRKITRAYLGHKDVKTNDQWQPYNSVNELKEVWKKNSKKNRPWEPFLDFQKKIYEGVSGKSNTWKNSININHYINYIAFQIITGTGHINNHNIPILMPTGKNRNAKIMPITYDFGRMLGQKDGQFFGISQNWLTSLVWSDELLRAKIHNRVIEILKHEKPYETYIKIVDKLRSVMGTEFDVFLKDTNYMNLVIKKRMLELSRRYLAPSFAISKNWKLSKKVQVFSDALLPVDIIIGVDKKSCSGKNFDELKISINFEIKKEIISKCINGKYYFKPIRLDKLSSLGVVNTNRRSHVVKLKPGGDLVSIEGFSSTKLSSITIVNVNPLTKSSKVLTENIEQFIPAYIAYNIKTKSLRALTKSGKRLKVSEKFELVNGEKYRTPNSFEGRWEEVHDKLFKAVKTAKNQHHLICWQDTSSKKCMGFRSAKKKKR